MQVRAGLRRDPPGPTLRSLLEAAMWHYVRVRLDRIGMVRDPESDEMITPDPRRPYRSDDPLVRAYPDMFCSDQELAAEAQRGEAPVEQATRAPGERRQVRKPKW